MFLGLKQHKSFSFLISSIKNNFRLRAELDLTITAWNSLKMRNSLFFKSFLLQVCGEHKSFSFRIWSIENNFSLTFTIYVITAIKKVGYLEKEWNFDWKLFSKILYLYYFQRSKTFQIGIVQLLSPLLFYHLESFNQWCPLKIEI